MSGPNRKVLVSGWPLAGPAERLLAANGIEVVQGKTDPDRRELASLLAEHRPDALIVRSGTVDKSCFDAHPDLKCIANHGAGHDSIDLTEATSRGIPVFAAPGRNAIAVAEQVFALLLAVRKRVLDHDALVRNGSWRPAAPETTELHGRRMGIVGLGAIGERVSVIARAFGMRVGAHDPVRTQPFPPEVTRCATLEDLLGTSDTVSLHVPLTDATRNMIDAAAIGRMPKGAVLINTARGGIVDEDALVDAIERGQLSGAGIDTFAQEPPGASAAVSACRAIVLSPHIAGVTPESALRMSMCCAENVIGFLERRTVSNDIVNPDWNRKSALPRTVPGQAEVSSCSG